MASQPWLGDLFGVKSVFGRVGAIAAQFGDYAASLIEYNTASPGRPATVRDALDDLYTGAAAGGENEISVAPGANQNNYEPTGWQDATIVVFTGNTDVLVTGFAAPSAGKPRVKKIAFTGTGLIRFATESASSTAANRVRVPRKDPSNTDALGMRQYDSMLLVYSTTSSRWHAYPSSRGDYVNTLSVSMTGTMNNLAADPNASSWSFTSGGAGPYVITGIVAPNTTLAVAAPKLVRFVSATTISNNNVGSTAANRFFTSTGADVAMPALSYAIVQYDTVNSRWYFAPLGTTATAAGTSYSNGTSGMTATNVQAAIDEIQADASHRQTFSEVTHNFTSTATVNNLAITGGDNATLINLTSDATFSTTLTGLAAPATNANGTTKWLRLVPGTYTITLKHNDAGSASANRFLFAGSTADIVANLTSGDIILLLTRRNNQWHVQRLGAADRLRYGGTDVTFFSGAPTAQHNLPAFASGNALSTVAPGDIMARMSASNHSTAALTFTANRRYTWNGSATPSLSVNTTGAIDGATVVVYFPASSISSITLSSAIDPTGTLAYAFDSASAAYELTLVWRAQGYVASAFRKVVLA